MSTPIEPVEPSGSDPFAGISDTFSDYAGTELETGRERAARINKASSSPLSLEPGSDDPTDLSTESVIAELSRSTLGSEAVILEAPFSYVGSTKRTLRWFRYHQAKATWLLILE